VSASQQINAPNPFLLSQLLDFPKVLDFLSQILRIEQAWLPNLFETFETPPTLGVSNTWSQSLKKIALQFGTTCVMQSATNFGFVLLTV
jgi:hypothetical protein